MTSLPVGAPRDGAGKAWYNGGGRRRNPCPAGGRAAPRGAPAAHGGREAAPSCSARRAPAGGLEAAGCGPGGAAPLCVRFSALRTAAARAFARPRAASVVASVAVWGGLADGF